MNETAKTIVYSLIALAYPIVVTVVYPIQDGDSSVNWLYAIPLPFLIGAIAREVVHRRQKHLQRNVSVHKAHYELLSFVIAALMLFASTQFWWSLNGGPSREPFISLADAVMIVMVGCGFMLVLNGGHALRWLYKNPRDPLVLRNHHIKASSAYSLSSVWVTGIVIVIFLALMSDLSALLNIFRYSTVVTIYALVLILHHSFSRIQVYMHAEEEHSTSVDLSSGFLSYCTGIGHCVLFVMFVMLHVPDLIDDAVVAFDAFINNVFFQPTPEQQSIGNEVGSIGSALTFGLFVIVGLSMLVCVCRYAKAFLSFQWVHA